MRSRIFYFAAVLFFIAVELQEQCESLSDGSAQSMHRANRLGDFPPIERFWEGGEFTLMGSGIYYKKILFIGVKVDLSNGLNLYLPADASRHAL